MEEFGEQMWNSNAFDNVDPTMKLTGKKSKIQNGQLLEILTINN